MAKPSGLRISDPVPWPFVIEGAMNGPVFLAYVRQCLVPTLKRGETVLMDRANLRKITQWLYVARP
jgi:hypothetical protein